MPLKGITRRRSRHLAKMHVEPLESRTMLSAQGNDCTPIACYNRSLYRGGDCQVDAPISLSGDELSNETYELTWRENSNNVVDFAIAYRLAAPSNINTGWTSLGTVPSDSVDANIASLDSTPFLNNDGGSVTGTPVNWTTYDFQVIAVASTTRSAPDDFYGAGFHIVRNQIFQLRPGNAGIGAFAYVFNFGINATQEFPIVLLQTMNESFSVQNGANPVTMNVNYTEMIGIIPAGSLTPYYGGVETGVAALNDYNTKLDDNDGGTALAGIWPANVPTTSAENTANADYDTSDAAALNADFNEMQTTDTIHAGRNPVQDTWSWDGISNGRGGNATYTGTISAYELTTGLLADLVTAGTTAGATGIDADLPSSPNWGAWNAATGTIVSANHFAGSWLHFQANAGFLANYDQLDVYHDTPITKVWNDREVMLR